MITGDNQLTAAFIAQQLLFGNGKSLFVTACDISNNLIEWSDLDDKKEAQTTSVKALTNLSQSALLCINGDSLDKLIMFKDAPKLI